MVGANWDFGYGIRLPSDMHNYSAEYANSDFDIRHRLTLSFTYQSRAGRVTDKCLDGWELNTITTLEGPQHWA